MNWISVRAKLPKARKNVMICQQGTDGVYVHFGWKNEDNSQYGQWTDACCTDENGDYVQMSSNQVSHWRDLGEDDSGAFKPTVVSSSLGTRIDAMMFESPDYCPIGRGEDILPGSRPICQWCGKESCGKVNTSKGQSAAGNG